MLKATIVTFALFLGAQAVAEGATPPPPSLKPERLYASEVVSTQDAEILHEAFEAAASGDWRDVERLQERARSEIVSDLILWRRATAGPPGMGFIELSEALERLQSWPNVSRIRSRCRQPFDLRARRQATFSDDLFCAGP
ncbi:MAG: hypothetical protein AAFO88_11560, partial [Pseudomonadota bacterium]